MRDFGFEALRGALGLGERPARTRFRFARLGMRRFGGERLAPRRGERLGRASRPPRPRRAAPLRPPAARLQCGAFALDRRAFALEPRVPARLLGEAGGERVAARVEVGEAAACASASAASAAASRSSSRARRSSASRLASSDRAASAASVSSSAASRAVTSAASAISASSRWRVLRRLRDVALEFGDARLGALLLLGERVARQRQPMQRRADARFLVAQRRQVGGGDRLQPRRLGLGAGALGDLAHVGFEPALGVGELRLALAPGDQPRQRLVAADVLRQIAIAVRLARLAFQAVDLRVDLLEDVLEPRTDCPRRP